MAIITISRGSHSRGVEVAHKVAERLGYRCLSRDVLLEASERYNIPEIKLERAIADAPSIVERLTHGKRAYVAYIRAAVLRNFVDDDVVYHGLGGHFFVQNIAHAFKVRILADQEERVAIVVDRDGVSEDEARQILARSDRARRQWGLRLYGLDPEDSALYDVVIHVGKMGTDGAADTICSMVGQQAFETTEASQAALEDLALAASIEAIAMEMELEQYGPEVEASGGEVRIRFSSPPRVRGGSFSEFRAHFIDDLRRRLLERTVGLPGMKQLEVELAQE